MSVANRVYLSLGSNVGDRRRYLGQARQAISHWAKTRCLAYSRVLETEPEGILNQRAFLNQALKIETALAPLPLLIWAKKTEIALGRRRRYRWGPREIDIDILLYGNERVCHPVLNIPHPAISKRPFIACLLSDLTTWIK